MLKNFRLLVRLPYGGSHTFVINWGIDKRDRPLPKLVWFSHRVPVVHDIFSVGVQRQNPDLPFCGAGGLRHGLGEFGKVSVNFCQAPTYNRCHDMVCHIMMLCT